MIYYNNKNIATCDFLQTGFDRLSWARAKELHRIMLKLQASNSIQHRFALITEVSIGATEKDG
jgi:hypothetical protein